MEQLTFDQAIQEQLAAGHSIDLAISLAAAAHPAAYEAYRKELLCVSEGETPDQVLNQKALALSKSKGIPFPDALLEVAEQNPDILDDFFE